MNISYIDYSIQTESLDIFCSGCNTPYCKGCYNTELSDFSCGKDWNTFKGDISVYIEQYPHILKNIFLLGGSFNHQDDEGLKNFLDWISTFNRNIYLFCREELEDVKPVFRKYCHYVKTGAFVPELVCNNNIQFGIKLATSNQNIYYVGDRYR